MAQVLRRDREATFEKLRQLQGVDLQPLAEEYGVYYESGPYRFVNLSWMLNTIEMLLELPINSLKESVFEDGNGPWRIELANLSTNGSTNGELWTMRKNRTTVRILEDDLLAPFRKSHLFDWITRQLLVGVSSYWPFKFDSFVGHTFRVSYFDTTAPKNRRLLEGIEADYELVRAVIGLENGYSMLTRYMCRWLDPPLTRKHDFGVREYWIDGP